MAVGNRDTHRDEPVFVWVTVVTALVVPEFDTAWPLDVDRACCHRIPPHAESTENLHLYVRNARASGWVCAGKERRCGVPALGSGKGGKE